MINQGSNSVLLDKSIPGRKRQIFDLLSLYQSSQIVGLIGENGTGKSTLVQHGLIPELHRGFLGIGGKNWKISTIRPGIRPIENLSSGFSGFIDENGKEKLEQEFSLTKEIKLHQDGLLQASKKHLSKGDGLNYLMVIDNFEDLFQFRESYEDVDTWDQNVNRFIQNITKCVFNSNVPIYFLLVLRSDFVTNIFAYRNFHELISKSQYSLPQFRKTEFQEVVHFLLEPHSIYMLPDAIDLLYTKLGRDLKNLQLLRLFIEHTAELCIQNSTIYADTTLLQQVDLNQLYQDSLEKIYEDCSPDEQKLVERIFKQITINKRGNSYRRPVRVEELMLVLGITLEELSPLLQKLKEDLSYVLEIIPPYQERLETIQNPILTNETVINIKNELFIPHWPRLIHWIEQEKSAQETYKRLSESAIMFEKELTGYLRPPDLDLTLNWYESHQPDEHWANQFEYNFHKTITYLKDGKAAFDEELRLKEALQKNKIKRIRKTGISVALISLLVSIVIGVFAFDAKNQEKQARIAQEKAEREKKRASLERERSDLLYLEADRAMKESKTNEQLALQEKVRADQESKRANDLRDEAEEQRMQIQEAFHALDRKTDELGMTVNELQISDSLKSVATKEAESARAYQVAVNKILTLRNNLQKEDLLTENGSEILKGLSSIYNDYVKASIDFKGLVLPNDDLYQVLMETRGRLFKLKSHNLASYNLASLPNGLRNLKLSPTNYLATGGDDGILLYSLQPMKSLPVTFNSLKIEGDRIRSLEFLKNTELMVGTVKGKLYHFNLVSERLTEIKATGLNDRIIEKIIHHDGNLFLLQGGQIFKIRLDQPTKTEAVTNLSASNIFKFRGDKLLVISNKSEVVLMEQKSLLWQSINSDLANKPISTAIISEDRVFFGMDNGDVYINQLISIGNFSSLKTEMVIPAHLTRITGLAYNKDSQKLFTASLDQKANIFDLNLRKLGPEYIINHALRIEGFNKWIWDFELFNKNQDENILTIDENGDLKFWQTSSEMLFKEIFENSETLYTELSER